MIRVVFLGRLAEAAGAPQIDMTLPDGVTDTGALRDWLSRTTPALNAPSVRMTLNRALLRDSCKLAAGDEVAFLPPVSGG